MVLVFVQAIVQTNCIQTFNSQIKCSSIFAFVASFSSYHLYIQQDISTWTSKTLPKCTTSYMLLFNCMFYLYVRSALVLEDVILPFHLSKVTETIADVVQDNGTRFCFLLLLAFNSFLQINTIYNNKTKTHKVESKNVLRSVYTYRHCARQRMGSNDLCPGPGPMQKIYRPQTKLREGNVFTGLCLFTGRGVVPSCRTPRDRTPPPEPQKWAVRILLECFVHIAS